MAIQLPRYKRQVGASAQPTAQIANTTDMGAEILGAGVKLGGTAMKFAGEYAKKIKLEESESQLAKFTADRKVRKDVFNRKISVMTDPKEIESSFDQWSNSERKILSDSELNKDAREEIEKASHMFFADSEISTNSVINKARIAKADIAWVDLQNMALEGDVDSSIMNPATGVSFSSTEELYNFATDKRVTLGTVDYESAMKSKRNFGQTVEFRQISKTSGDNPDVAQDMLDKSSQPPENTVLLEKRIRDDKDIRNRKIVAIQSETSNNMNKLLGQRALTRTEIDNAVMNKQNVMGIETSLLSEEEGDALIASLDSLELGDIDSVPDAFEFIADGWKTMFKQANKGKWDQEGFDKIMKTISFKKKGSSRPALSKGTIESQLNFAQNNLYKVAEGINLNSETTDALISIADTFATINEDSPGNVREHVKALNSSVNSFMEWVKENGGNLNNSQIKEWRDSNFSRQIQDTAMIKARNTYRIGEPVKPGVTPIGGFVIDSDFEGPSSYRYIGGGEFERID